MEQGHPPDAEQIALICRLAEEEEWGLDAAECALLAARYLPPPGDTMQLQLVVANMRRDFRLVEALRCGDAVIHGEAWAAWLGQAQAILRHSGLAWANDDSVEFEDLAQIAALELVRSLASYRYASRFSTWAYQVITRGVQRHLRALAAKKRLAAVDRQVDVAALEICVPDDDLPEQHAHGRSLATLIDSELTRALGSRNAAVFQLWARHDYSVDMISRRVGLSSSRIHAILAQARAFLQHQDTVRHWHEAGPTL